MVLCSVFEKIADKCVEPIVEYVKTEVGHLWNYSANLKKLEEEVDNMKAETTAMKDRIKDAESRLGKIKVDALAEIWLTKMACVSDEADRIIKEEDRETGSCLMGLRPNLWACYLASKSAKKVIDGAHELKNERKEIKTVAHIDRSRCLGFAINSHYEELESRKRASELIVTYLKDPSVKMVAMYGMGGMGKSTLAETIGVQLYNDSTFSYVVKAVVSNNQKTDLTQIQKQIADLLKISLGDEKDDVMARANQLREQLMKKDKVLIILDDIWSKFDLRDVGIPLDRDLKLLITSRDVNVMIEMDSKHNVPLGDLSSEDSWKLFDRMADGVDPDSDRYSTAREVVKQCFGIPVLLVTIARTLRPRDLETWKEALLQLERFEGDKYVEDGYKRLEVSYNFLPNDELRSLFLLCAQLDHRSVPIDDLLRYTMGLGLFDKREKLTEVRSRLHSHLGDLKRYCLLQDGDTERTVRMHDVVHRFAASIANRGRGISSSVAEAQIQEWPSKDEVEQFSISLPHRHLPPDHQLPIDFDSSKLESFLLLRGEYGAFLNVPDEFFIGMKKLKLVDIRRMSLSPVLCSSLNDLEKLRTLCLDYCKLDDTAMIGELPMLQVLSLKGSTVSQIGRLGSSLKLLDLRDCTQLKVIASGVFCNLTLLEDLRIGYRSFDKWEPLQGCNNGSDHETSTRNKLASLREFKNLGNLINLDIQIPDPKTFPKDLVFAKLERFHVLIGIRPYDWRRKRIDSEGLEVKLVEDIQLYEGIKVLMRKAEKLRLEEIQGVTSVSGLLFPVGSLPNLTSIHVSCCHVLKYLFSSRLALRGLLCLKKISVEHCLRMESIVSRESENRITDDEQLDDEEEEIIEFTQLGALKLSTLGDLISFYSSSTPSPIISSSQERQEQDPMSNQELSNYLFNKKVAFPNLEEVSIWGIRKVKMIWENQLLLNLRKVTVDRCPNLISIFPASVALSLKQLETLRIAACENLKEIVSKEEEEDGGPILVFSKLTYLHFQNLPELERFYGGGAEISDWASNKLIEAPSNLNVQKVDALFAKVAFPNLEELTICGMHKVKMIWENQLHLNLRKVTVINCPNLTSIFPESVALALKQLETLRIDDCENLKEIVSKEEKEDGGRTIVFPRLTDLYLYGLPELVRFWGGGADISDWPSLSDLTVRHCDKLIDPPNLNNRKNAIDIAEELISLLAQV